MKRLEILIDGMTFNEYLNFIRRSWRKHCRREWIRHSKEEMDEIASMKDIGSIKDLQRSLDRAFEILNNAKQRNDPQ